MEELIELEECPCCRGVGTVVHEGGWNVQIECIDCGAHTVYIEYDTEIQKQEAERTAARLWNLGKVVKINPGE